MKGGSTTTPDTLLSASISESIGLPCIVVIEDENTFEDHLTRIRAALEPAGFQEVNNPASALAMLGKGEQVLWIEDGVRLDPRIETLVTDYSAGVASFADSGSLISAAFDPFAASFVIVISRSALEASYAKLAEHAGAVVSLN